MKVVDSFTSLSQVSWQDRIDSPLCAALVTAASSAMASTVTMSADLDVMLLLNDVLFRKESAVAQLL